jgi:hypothetical protein
LVVLEMTLEAIAVLKDTRKKLFRQMGEITNLIESLAWIASEDIECDCGGEEDGFHSRRCSRRMNVNALSMEN